MSTNLAANLKESVPGNFAGRLKRYWPLLVWFAGPALVRLVIMPLSHPWDTQTWYAFFNDLHTGRSPYDTMTTLSLETRSEKVYQYYEYYAYPPGLIYIYWPIAKLYALFDPNLGYYLGKIFLPAMTPMPWIFPFFFKIPIMLADLGVAALLWVMGGREVARKYTWSPYAILAVTWMFDSMMVLCILWAVYALKKGQLNRAAIALALGTVLKFVPVFIVPAILLYLIRRNATFMQLVRFSLVFGVVTLGLIAPYLRGTLFTLEFHGARPGGGLSWHSVFYLFSALASNPLDSYSAIFISAAVGSLTLPIGMLITYAYTYRKNLNLNSTIIVTLLGYLVSTKIVNEVYVLPIVPLILLELQANYSANRERYYKLLWAMPFAVAMINVPVQYFFVQPLVNLGQFNYPAILDVDGPIRLHFLIPALAIVGTLYTYVSFKAIRVFSISEMTAETETSKNVVGVPSL
jgi:hypothetical protein